MMVLQVCRLGWGPIDSFSNSNTKLLGSLMDGYLDVHPLVSGCIHHGLFRVSSPTGLCTIVISELRNPVDKHIQ